MAENWAQKMAVRMEQKMVAGKAAWTVAQMVKPTAVTTASKKAASSDVTSVAGKVALTAANSVDDWVAL